MKVMEFETAYEEFRKSQEERLQLAVSEAQERMRLQLMEELQELKEETTAEMAIQRSVFQEEILSLNRALEERKADLLSSPVDLSPLVTKKSSWEEIEHLVQNTHKKLEDSSAKHPVNKIILFKSTFCCRK